MYMCPNTYVLFGLYKNTWKTEVDFNGIRFPGGKKYNTWFLLKYELIMNKSSTCGKMKLNI